MAERSRSAPGEHGGHVSNQVENYNVRRVLFYYSAAQTDSRPPVMCVGAFAKTVLDSAEIA